MTAHPPSDASKAQNASLFKNRLTPKDTRQHSPCRSCYADCISTDTTHLLQFHCTNCGKDHTNTRGDSLNHTRFLNRYSTVPERNT